MPPKKKHKNNKQVARPTVQSTPIALAVAPVIQIENQESPIDRITKVSEEVWNGAQIEDIDNLPAEPTLEPSTTPDRLAQMAEEALGLLRIQSQRVSERDANLDEREERIVADESASALLREELTADQEKVSAMQQCLDAASQDLRERERQITERELNALSGFLTEQREAEKVFSDEVAALRSQSLALTAEIAKERAEWNQQRLQERKSFDFELAQEREAARNEIMQRLNQLESELEVHREALSKDQQELSKSRMDLRRQQGLLQAGQENLTEDRASLEQHILERSSGMVEKFRHVIHTREQELASAREDRDILAETLRTREAADRRFGHQSPEQVLDELRRVVQERDQLKIDLASRLDSESLERLRQLELEQNEWRQEQARLTQSNQALKHQLTKVQIATTELESLRDHKAALESGRDLLHKAIEELRAEVDDRIRRADGRSPFPACSLADQDTELLATLPNVTHSVSLAEFTTDLQQRIAFDPTTDKRLYYSKRDLRCYLGGMAMSSLHILQGISGTGKTSLPRAFARAIGAECKVIEVQAGWRDRQDLLGHFNAFEHTFYETPFLKSLYRALCPRHKDLPYFLVLDEMNLSHPEQYFADVLSAIETEQPLKLIASPAEPAPSRMELGGQEIRIGSNIWFVGTANHDETTKEFADKTYDRSHVMELPRHRETFPQTKILQREPIALEALRTSFENARDRYQDKADVAYAFLDEYLAELLDRRFKIGWGNRLQRQMGLYIPVVLAAGGSLGEAVDHIVATKLIRKLRNRHENRSEDVRDLHNRLKEGLESLDAPWMSSSQPVTSLQWLQDELHRLGEENGD